MKKQSRHPSRQDMLRAIETGCVEFSEHLKECASCRDLFEVMGLLGESSLRHTNASQFYDLTAIPRAELTRLPGQLVAATVASDSWKGQPAVAMRDLGARLERRMRLQAGKYVVELHAERTEGKWEFVAKVFFKGKSFREYVLTVGRRKLYSTRHDCVYWSSDRPTAKLKLHTADGHYDLGVVAW